MAGCWERNQEMGWELGAGKRGFGKERRAEGQLLALGQFSAAPPQSAKRGIRRKEDLRSPRC